MAVACASRFAVLKLEDDDVSDSTDKKSKTSGIQNNSAVGKNKALSKVGPSESKSKPKKKKKTSNEIAELQNLAFGNHKPKHKSSSNNVKLVNASVKQWEEWKQKDSEFVSEAYEQDLQEAILLSKIDYEEKKEVYDAIQKECEQTKNTNKKKKKSNQKKEKGTMSLDEFQCLDAYQIDSGSYQKVSEIDDLELQTKPDVIDQSNFFCEIQEDAEKIITREQKQDQYNRTHNPVVESARLLQYQEDLRKKDEEISNLTESVKKLKDELRSVKSRNKKLYQILESGEMREKAEILVQIDELTSIKDELTDQLSEYHTALEQERSKVHSLQMELKKFQNNKKMRTESK